MRILMIGDFRRDSPHFLLNNPRMFQKGFLRNGHDVLDFSYRDMLLQNSPVKSRGLALALAKKKTDGLLLELARHFQPEMIFVAAFKLLDSDTLGLLKQALPHATVMCWYSDMYEGVDPPIAKIARQCDWFLATGAGEFLQEYKNLGIAHCAFMPNPCDPDVEHPGPTDSQTQSGLLFTGKPLHGRGRQDPMRQALLETLSEHKGLTCRGGPNHPSVKGNDYLDAIRGAKMTISINAYNDVRLYHSDRLTHYLGCGAFVLAKYVPDSELLFEDKKHLCYFTSIEQCTELIDYYTANDSERVKIAQEGMRQSHTEFHCQKLAEYVVNLATHGSYEAPWSEII